MGWDPSDWAGFPITIQDFDMARNGGLGVLLQVVEGLHRRLSDFIHEVVVHHREEAIRRWRNWLREDPHVHPKMWLRSDLVPLAPFSQCDPLITLGGSGFLADPHRIDEEFRIAWLPYFCRSGQRETSLEEFTQEVDGWLLFCRRFLCFVLLERCLLKWFIVKVLLLVVWMAGGGVSSRLSRFLGLMVLLVFFQG